ncbi:ABC transporter ATP-binding protein, partial [Escherichia coli]
IAEFKKAGTTLLLVSHSASDIVRHCDRAIFLKNGSIELDGSSRDVTNRYMDELFGKTNSLSEYKKNSTEPKNSMALFKDADPTETKE